MLEKGVASHLSPRQSYASNYTVDSFMTPRELRSCRVTEFHFNIFHFSSIFKEILYFIFDIYYEYLKTELGGSNFKNLEH